MDDRAKTSLPQETESDGGLYKNVAVSPKTLGYVIVAGCIILCLLMYMGTRKGAYTVTYNSRGGSDVQSQNFSFQEELSLADAPDREGYRFTGWYLDEACAIPAEPNMLVENEMQLYAGWEPESK